MFKNVTGKLGNMRKAQDWVLYPQQADTLNLVVIQCDNRIAKVDLDTAKAILSDGKGGHQGMMKLHPSMGAKLVDVPGDMLDAIKAHVKTNRPGEGIGGQTVLGNPAPAPAAKSYKVGVKTPGDTDFVFNAERWPTEAQAKEAGSNLAARWTAVKEWKVFPSDDEPNK